MIPPLRLRERGLYLPPSSRDLWATSDHDTRSLRKLPDVTSSLQLKQLLLETRLES